MLLSEGDNTQHGVVQSIYTYDVTGNIQVYTDQGTFSGPDFISNKGVQQ